MGNGNTTPRRKISELGVNNEIHLACQLGDAKKVGEMLDENIDLIEQKGFLENTPLIVAAASGKAEIVQTLIHRGANIHAQTNNGWTALMKALQSGHKEVAQILAHEGSVLQVSSWAYHEHMTKSEDWGLVKIWKNKEEVLNDIPEKKKKKKKKKKRKKRKTNEVGTISSEILPTEVLVSVSKELENRVQQKLSVLILEYVGMEVNDGGNDNSDEIMQQQHSDNTVAITEAMDHTKIEELQHTTSGAGYEMSATKNESGEAIIKNSEMLCLPLSKRYSDSSLELVENDHSKGRRFTLGIFVVTATCGLVKNCTSQLLNEKSITIVPDPIKNSSRDESTLATWSGTDSDSDSSFESGPEEKCEIQPVHFACIGNDVAKLREEIEKNPRCLQAKDEFENTPLILTAYRGAVDTASMLLRMGAKLNKADSFGRTALMEAARLGHEDVVTLLLKAGADFLSIDGAGQSALTLAISNGHRNIAESLAQYGARVPINDRPMMKVAREWNLEKVWNQARRKGLSPTHTEGGSKDFPYDNLSLDFEDQLVGLQSEHNSAPAT